ncbi:transcriptional regulator [Cellulomonas sp. WB94]|uniref:winged helix-turn-helix domain-containing protein n=1 Tax=Cellulomonas sp. WB94 TaxID=2173174 RepID=UPI000D582897|nr:winged helix-turn-helix domain-containing protein [Cellulomonas sp. WB94]PVU83134.1 transcriptional regulator [Cellulomonas sp. WB94]
MTTSVELLAPTPPLRAGFVLYVGLHDDPDGGPTGARELAEVAETLRDLARELMPTAETFTALSLVPQRAGPDDVQTLRDRLSHLHPLEHDALADTASGVRIDLEAHQVHVDGRPVCLTRTEFALLAHLVRAPHRVVGRDELLHAVWGGTSRPGSRTLDVHVRRLRAKVTGAAVVTVRGIGYRFDPTPRIVLHGSGDAL